MNRRQFLSTTAVTCIGAAFPPLLQCGTRARLRILMLGGTGFVGSAVVSEALARGHHVTLFNRGMTNPGLFASLERVHGDRTDRNAYDSLRGRDWDVVVDTWQDDPAAVQEAAAFLRGRIGHYAYVSTIAVYGGRNFRVPYFDEAAPLPAEVPASSYPARKQRAERHVAANFPDSYSLHRAHGIHGAGPFGRLDNGATGAWWPVRVLRGGEMLAPGDGSDTTQYTDVRSLARFILDVAALGLTGPFNVCETLPMRDFLSRVRAVTGSGARFTWIPAEFLFERNIRSFSDIPMWVSRHEAEGAFYRASTDRARSAGFRGRSFELLVEEVLRAFHLHHSAFDFADPDQGLRIARVEGRLLDAWHTADKRG